MFKMECDRPYQGQRARPGNIGFSSPLSCHASGYTGPFDKK